MATRSAIGILRGDVCQAVYCHWDGDPSYNGRILQEHYDNDRTGTLISYGDMSSLAPKIVPTEGSGHSFDKPEKGVCIFYGRDRNESNTEWRVVNSAEDLFDEFAGCEYFYVMKDGTWYVSEGRGSDWKLLSEVLEPEIVCA